MFRNVKGLWLPAGAASWLITALALAFCINVFIVIDRHSHSGTDTLYGIFPYWACTLLLHQWLGGLFPIRSGDGPR
jgi:hypothetical protein